MRVKFGTGSRFRLELFAIHRLQRKPRSVAVADAKDRVDRSGNAQWRDRLPAELWKLIVDQPPYLTGVDVDLVAMHRYRVRPNSRSISAFLSST